MLSMLFVCITFISCQGQSNGIPTCVQDNFKKMFPQAVDVDWEKEGKFYTVDFEINTVDKEAWFDNDCKWRMTESDVLYANLPQIIKTAVENSNYSAWRIEDIDYIERVDHASFYVIEIEQGEKERLLFYDAFGKLLKDTTDRDESYKNLNKTLNF